MRFTQHAHPFVLKPTTKLTNR